MQLSLPESERRLSATRRLRHGSASPSNAGLAYSISAATVRLKGRVGIVRLTLMLPCRVSAPEIIWSALVRAPLPPLPVPQLAQISMIPPRGW
jgi:hypothetical protein